MNIFSGGNLCLKSFIRNYGTVKLAPKYDMVIIGGGMVGFGLAALAGSSKYFGNKKILLIETLPHKKYEVKEEYDIRVVAINIASKNMLKNIGAWDYIKSHRAQPVKHMKIWETQSNSYLTLDRDPLAYIVENNLIVESLYKSINSLVDSKKLTILHNSKPAHIQIPSKNHLEQLVRLDIQQLEPDSNTQSIQTHLLIGADGAHSEVRKAANLSTVGWDHGQKAIVATLRVNQNPEDQYTAWQRFIPTGPIALLPLSDKFSSLTWSTTSSEADRLMQLNEFDFVYELNTLLTQPCPQPSFITKTISKLGQSFVGLIDWYCNQTDHSNRIIRSEVPWTAPVIESMQPNTKRASFSLGFQHATFYSAPRVALVGDAAHRILPLAGQGLNLGYGDVVSLVKHLEIAIAHGVDIGSPTYLKDYTNERQRSVVPFAATMELLNFLYSTSALKKNGVEDFLTGILANLRSSGMSVVESSNLIKNILIESAISGQVKMLI